jgi:TolA-binding protein
MRNLHSLFLTTATAGLTVGLVALPLKPTHAQWSTAADPQTVEHARAVEAYDNHQYALALHTFESLLAQAPSETSDAYVEASYFAAMSALALYHRDAVHRVETFIRQFPESPLALEARWELANYNYKRKNYSTAAEEFEKIRVRELAPARRDEYRFKLGHCYFEREEYEKARVPLYEVLEVEGDFQAAAQYYFAHIAYLKGQPQVALDGFEKIAEHPDFAELVPLYITQLLHATGQFDRLKEYAPPLLDESSGLEDDAVAEVAHLLGDAWYRDEDFATASPYLELAWEGTDGPGRNPEFAYAMGYTRYRLGDWRGALDCLPLATYGEDELAQNAAYHMADCYLEMGDRARAKQAFKTAATPEFDLDIQEDAFFHYAKLAYELSFNPFDDAIVAFETYLEQFPSSPRRDEAYRFLLQVHMTSRDYERALKALGNIAEPDETVRAAAQVLAFNRAVELYQNNQLTQALTFFKRSREHNVDPQLHAETFYWEGEIMYNKGNYKGAAAAYAKFSTTPGSYLSELHNDADYARGYAHYKSEKYTDALSAFRSYLETNPDDDPSRMRDAELRAADCFYALKSFDQAADYYDRVLARGVKPLDYALFQRAMSAKLDDDLEGQTSRLDQLLVDHPDSRLVVEALFQAGRTHIELGQLAEAEEKLLRLVDDYSATPRAKQALVELCLVGVKQGQDDKVLTLWDRIRTEYGNDNVAADAYNIVEPLLIKRGLLDNLPAAVGLDGAEIEQRIFESASYLALENRCGEAIPRLEEYVRQYPAGLHISEAQFYLGNCLFDQGATEPAYQAYVAVLAMPAGEFTEAAALGAATIAWNGGDHRAALGHYETLEEVAVLQTNRLEAAIGQMRCHYLLGQESAAADFAARVMYDPGTPDDIRRTAQLWNARIACNQGQHATVLEDLNALVTFGGSAGAEAKYLLAEHDFNQGAFEACETALFQLIETFYNQATWRNKGFLLLVRTYVGLNDLFQARATAESILANVSSPDVQEAVSDLLLEIDALEAAQQSEGSDEAPTPESNDE